MATASPGSFSDWVPEEIRAWFRSLHAGQPRLACEITRRIGAVLYDSGGYNVRLSGPPLIRRLKKRDDWQERLENFLDAAARAADLPEPQRRTPKEAQTIMSEVARDVRRLAGKIKIHDDLFMNPSYQALALVKPKAKNATGEMYDVLEKFSKHVEEDRDFRMGDTGGPALGRADGGSAAENERIRAIALAAIVHLGDPYPRFTAAVASTICNRRIPESTLRSLSPKNIELQKEYSPK